ncbi:hypothetical protein P9G51_15400, partial [Bacillus velezensis]|uniref:hypothetical protein n=1 Tax=Bacillus velezensis TaxID=492670 RepID=UPI002DB8949E
FHLMDHIKFRLIVIKPKKESASMNFKKSIFIVLGLSLTLVCGLGMNTVEKQAQDTIKVASDRLQT